MFCTIYPITFRDANNIKRRLHFIFYGNVDFWKTNNTLDTQTLKRLTIFSQIQ